MSRVPVAIFEQYGDDAEAALQAFANISNAAWSEYVDESTERQYRLDYSAWRRSLARSARKERLADDSGQVRLFEPPESSAKVELRERLVLDGNEFELRTLTDTGVIRKVAQRDLAPAVTTVERCKSYFALADHMDAETDRLGRPVTAGEVLGWAA